MSPKEASRTSRGGGSRFTEAMTPGRIAMAALAVVTLVFIFQNTREVKIRILVPEVTMPLYLALLATAVVGAACGFYAAARRRK
ncbi:MULTISPECIES: lipopolysaccharide assembly protein LapA domain-containing protein [unclassified Streptomyces]|uniref:lipopolysaccharide assembly protein LapA domain-containing protein n=1 Tax=unclassified Streptomyces TaxID=2593676 RepID=UPI0036B8E333